MPTDQDSGLQHCPSAVRHLSPLIRFSSRGRLWLLWLRDSPESSGAASGTEHDSLVLDTGRSLAFVHLQHVRLSPASWLMVPGCDFAARAFRPRIRQRVHAYSMYKSRNGLLQDVFINCCWVHSSHQVLCLVRHVLLSHPCKHAVWTG